MRLTRDQVPRGFQWCGIASFFMSWLTIARERIEQNLALYRPETHVLRTGCG